VSPISNTNNILVWSFVAIQIPFGWSLMLSTAASPKPSAFAPKTVVPPLPARPPCSEPEDPVSDHACIASPRHVLPLSPGINQALAIGHLSGNRNCERRMEPIRGIGLLLKRIMDLVLSSIAIVLTWPLMLVIAIAVKLESPGPAIYPSPRAGERGQKFLCYKFRTMIEGADALKESLRPLNQRQDPFFKIEDDPRVTRLGRFLRKYSLDELPQFWNTLKGDMSLVGPRPHPVDDYVRYSPEHHRRLDVKPGITGLWQVTARTNPSFETTMLLDLEYMEHWSLLLDCKILMRTVPAVLAGEGQ
jgi:lipopolysaccharide/colanic/teichoic acid biosynthesis glycosyltransferase